MSEFNFYAKKPSEDYHKVDMWLVVSILLLWGLGIFTLFACTKNHFTNNSFGYVRRQLISSAIGFVLFFIFLFTDIKVIRKAIGLIVVVSFILCLLTFIKPLSIEKNGARRWLKMPGNFSFQPSELVKFAIVLFLANYFDKQERLENPDEKNLLPSVIILVVFVGVVILQKDMSTSLFILLIGILLFFVAGQKLLWIIPFSILAIPTGLIAMFLEKYRIKRILGWLHPDQFNSTLNYQARAAKNAISSGGIWGSGIGSGLVKINSIPENQADYIFAGWAEAMGFVGVIAYIILLLFFAWRGYKSAINCGDRFSSYAGFGCVSVIFMQSMVNIMVVCGLLPSTGIPLPFFSLGGSSIIITLAMCGFILNTSRGEESIENISEFDEVSLEDFSYLS